MGFVDDTIGNWTVTQLVKFLQDQQTQNPPTNAPALTCENLVVTRKLKIFDEVQFFRNFGSATAGSASALPATPAGYIPILDYTGQVKLVPYYNI